MHKNLLNSGFQLIDPTAYKILGADDITSKVNDTEFFYKKIDQRIIKSKILII